MVISQTIQGGGVFTRLPSMVAYVSCMATCGFFFHGHQAASPKGSKIAIFDLDVSEVLPSKDK
jgi:hypothetical protein